MAGGRGLRECSGGLGVLCVGWVGGRWVGGLRGGERRRPSLTSSCRSKGDGSGRGFGEENGLGSYEVGGLEAGWLGAWRLGVWWLVGGKLRGRWEALCGGDGGAQVRGNLAPLLTTTPSLPLLRGACP